MSGDGQEATTTRWGGHRKASLLCTDTHSLLTGNIIIIIKNNFDAGNNN